MNLDFKGRNSLVVFVLGMLFAAFFMPQSIKAAEENAIENNETQVAPITATLHVIKHVINDGSGTSTASEATMYAKLTATGENVLGSPFAGAENPGTLFVLNPGTYTVSEEAMFGYTQSYSGDCISDPNDVHLGQITLIAGDEKTCTITNDDFGAPPQNQAPVWTGPTYASTTLGSGFDLIILATDPDNDALTVTSTIPNGATYNASSGEFKWTPTETGTSTAFFSASDLATSTDFTITLEVFNNVSTSTATLHVIKHVVNDNGGIATSSDATMFVKIAATGENVSGSPAFGMEVPGREYILEVGTYTVSEDALLGYNQTYSGDCISDPNDVHLGQITLIAGDEKTCTITNDDVVPPEENLPPYFVNFNPPLTATATILYSYDANAADPENDALRFYFEIAPAGMTIASSTGLIEWTPAENQVTSTPYAVQVAVSDGLYATSTSYSIVVNAKPAPLTQCSDGIDNDGDGKIDMSDPGCANANDNDETDPSGGGGGGGGGGVVIVVPPGGGGGGSQNYPPRFRDFNPPIIATATLLYSYQVDAYDLENDPITYSLGQAPSGMVISPTTGLITWYPLLSQVSGQPYAVKVVISDGRGSADANYLVTVVWPVNLPPPLPLPATSTPPAYYPPLDEEKFEPPTPTSTATSTEAVKGPSLFASLLAAIGNLFSCIDGLYFLGFILVFLLIIWYLLRKNRKLKEELEIQKEKEKEKKEEGIIDLSALATSG